VRFPSNNDANDCSEDYRAYSVGRSSYREGSKGAYVSTPSWFAEFLLSSVHSRDDVSTASRDIGLLPV
jgi:hypothetical protein